MNSLKALSKQNPYIKQFAMCIIYWRIFAFFFFNSFLLIKRLTILYQKIISHCIGKQACVVSQRQIYHLNKLFCKLQKKCQFLQNTHTLKIKLCIITCILPKKCLQQLIFSLLLCFGYKCNGMQENHCILMIAGKKDIGVYISIFLFFVLNNSEKSKTNKKVNF